MSRDMAGKEKIRLGTRGSALAMVQAREVKALLEERVPGLEVELVEIATTGDKRLDIALSSATSASGGTIEKGLFTKELENALLDEEIDIAVHSLKDVPTEQPESLEVVVTLPREQTSDLLLTKDKTSWQEFPQGAVVATSSERRKWQLLQLREDLEIVPVRGNVPTRLKKFLNEEKWSGMVLAQAGLLRLGYLLNADKAFNEDSQHGEAGWFEHEGEKIFFQSMGDRMPGAAGQGAIAVECRRNDLRVISFLQKIHDETTWECVGMEREILRRLGGGCQMPLGILAKKSHEGIYRMRAQLFRVENGKIQMLEGAGEGMNREAVIAAVAEQLGI